MSIDCSIFLHRWWLDWLEWNKEYAGKKFAARKLTGKKFKKLEDAPGCYVTKRLGRPERR